MSRLGKMPVDVPSGVEVKSDGKISMLKDPKERSVIL
jgi:ribosomal protein L6P/L9E